LGHQTGDLFGGLVQLRRSFFERVEQLGHG
jgi:hypothetical protein